jgi:Protein of unknown function (DUF4242)
MPTYVIRRPAIAASAAELDAALTRLRCFEDTPAAARARWIHSCALREPDGRFGLLCVFEADSVQALEQHAASTGLPAREILPVAATRRGRAFAPARVYLVWRRSAWPGKAAFERSAAIARRIAEEDMARELVWLHSHLVDEGDGRLGSACLYQAVGPAALREHARRAGMPADEIIPVLGRVVFRDDTLPPAAQGSAVPA